MRWRMGRMDRSAYDRWFELEDRHFWRVAKRELILELVERHRPAPAPGQPLRLLDIGGACTLLTRELGRFGEITMVEHDEEMARFAAETLGLPVRQGSLPDRLPADLGGPFDVITLIDVLEHIDDDVAAARAVLEILRPGGLAVISVPAVPLLWSEHDVSVHHRRRYMARTLRPVLTAAGFAVERLTYHTSLLFPAVLAQRLWSRLRRGLEARAEYPVHAPPAVLNRAFYAVMNLERRLLRRVDMPIGSSLVAICRRVA